MSTDQKYLALINERAKYGPIPPPVIIRQDEAGDPNEYFSVPPIIWLRRAALYDFNQGIQKPFGSEAGLNTNIDKQLYNLLPTLKIPFLLEHLTQKNIPVLAAWVQEIGRASCRERV